jgi:hypothetical protein
MEKLRFNHVCRSHSERAKMKRLLFLFQKDLLPGISGQILEAKDTRENRIIAPVAPLAKVVAWLFLGFLTIGMLFYLFLFTLSEDASHQMAWGKAFAIWLVQDIFLVSTGMVIFVHIFLPSLVFRDVVKIKRKLLESIEAYDGEKVATPPGAIDKNKDLLHINKELKREVEEVEERESNKVDAVSEVGYDNIIAMQVDGKHDEENHDIINEPGTTMQRENSKSIRDDFNAAKYLFVSYRVAEIYPDFKVSRWILQFRTVWPRQSYQHVIHTQDNYSFKFESLSNSVFAVFGAFLMVSLPMLFFTLPLPAQDIIQSLVMTTIWGFSIYFLSELFISNPPLVVVPIVAVALLYYLWQRFMKNKVMYKEEADCRVVPVKRSIIIPLDDALSHNESVSSFSFSSIYSSRDNNDDGNLVVKDTDSGDIIEETNP